ncbi:CPBP family intramembrane glutamic endopeptidase [Marinicella rhabdoformis]|uniref:CPBP family intramembrane glutamic endopeptidase n=1 Tax=Marinicella rhabdoformis TaxID=2580566 RepID=UPI0012AECE92|nr:CPBP family intramembrane glutamic endopeptidase [Marinicella rhabdoformis]
MLGNVVILLVSWLLLHFVLKQNLSALGWSPVLLRLKQLFCGFALMVLLCGLVYVVRWWISGTEWQLAEGANWGQWPEVAYWHLRSVLFEELIFRGALLVIAIQFLGARWALLISAAVFGVYHWFSYGILGQWIPMLFVFLGTGLTGWVWAFAFHKSGSLALPIGLHFGWNFISNVFAQGPVAAGVFVSESTKHMSEWGLLLHSVVGMFMAPLLTYVVLRFLFFRDKSVSTKS